MTGRLTGPLTAAGARDCLHASSVALNGAAVLLLGPSGAGKSALALDLMSRGAALVSDDQTIVFRQGATLFADAPAAIRGQIEARGIGLIAAQPAGATPVALAVDLERAEAERLPPARTLVILGVKIQLICGRGTVNLAPAILQYLKSGRVG